MLEQSFSDYEIIILDDASTDESISIINSYKHNRKIRCIENKRNSGSPFKQWNKGVKEATGDYLWFAESDDWADKSFLSELVEVLDNNPDLGLVYCQSLVVNETDQIIDSCLAWTAHLHPKLWCSDFVMDGQLFCSKYLMFGNVMPNASAILIRRKVWDEIGPANEDMRLCGDWLQWANILSVSNVGFIARPLNFFRGHPDTSRARLMGNPPGIREMYRVIWYISRNCPTSQNNLQKALSQFAAWWLSNIMNNSRNPEVDKLWQAVVTFLRVKEYDSRLGRTMLKYLSLYYARMASHLLPGYSRNIGRLTSRKPGT